jgi:hypothetical protein
VPFKLGTFERGGQAFVGLVLKDTQVADVGPANAAFEAANASAPSLAAPGDMISGGSPAGTNIARAEPRWMRAGDTAVCAIEGIGTQSHPVVAEPSTPTH